MGMRRVDQNMGRRDSRGPLDLLQGRVHNVRRRKQNVAANDCDFVIGWALDHDGHSPQSTLLALRVSWTDTARDYHRVIGVDVDRSPRNAQVEIGWMGGHVFRTDDARYCHPNNTGGEMEKQTSSTR
jgi:hypothetical protein